MAVQVHGSNFRWRNKIVGMQNRFDWEGEVIDHSALSGFSRVNLVKIDVKESGMAWKVGYRDCRGLVCLITLLPPPQLPVLGYGVFVSIAIESGGFFIPIFCDAL